MTPSGVSDGVPVESARWPERTQPPVLSGVPAPDAAPLWALAGRDFAAWRLGEAQALERLVRRVTPTLWHVARGYQLDRTTAEDVVQATWLAMVRNAGAVRDEMAVLHWLTVTTRREAWRVGRVLRREDAVEPELLATTERSARSAEEEAITDADARALWRQVARLPPRCQRILRAIAFEERPNYRALSADLQMAGGSIGPTRRRCLVRLRELLAEDVEWGPDDR
ncbi:MAG TPA: sigma-70 family RNA polymerase sigma factor [Mycobacteriales bacterium]|nr:sigma-70 family RNA polymerase sigma factor [Mycobacteriales bacterium]